MKIKKLLILPLLLSLGFLSSCDEDEPKIEYMATYPVSGEWVVNYYVENSAGKLEEVAGHTQLRTYNTAANTPTEIWIDDNETFWHYKIKSALDMSNLSFSVQNAINAVMLEEKDQEGNTILVPYDIKVNIMNGKVMKNATRTNGIQTDSIYFQVSFEDDEEPFGTIYHAAGHRNTGFE